MKHEKPGPKKKSAKIMNRKTRLHNIPKDIERPCVRCDKLTGTERYAHYEGYRKHYFGKGTGVKCNDHMTAWFCQRCTDSGDYKPDKMDFEAKIRHSEEWFFNIFKTWFL